VGPFSFFLDVTLVHLLQGNIIYLNSMETVMMPVVRIADETWARLQQHARPFEDTPDDVIRKALDALEGSSPLEQALPTKMPRKAKRKATDKLPQKEFRQPLMRALLGLGGTAQASDIRDVLEPAVKPLLRAGDMDPVSTGDPRWWNAVCWERSELVKEGLFRPDSPRGVWELSDTGLKAAKALK
jgi:hypothetical protein